MFLQVTTKVTSTNAFPLHNTYGHLCKLLCIRVGLLDQFLDQWGPGKLKITLKSQRPNKTEVYFFFCYRAKISQVGFALGSLRHLSQWRLPFSDVPIIISAMELKAPAGDVTCNICSHFIGQRRHVATLNIQRDGEVQSYQMSRRERASLITTTSISGSYTVNPLCVTLSKNTTHGSIYVCDSYFCLPPRPILPSMNNCLLNISTWTSQRLLKLT